MKAVFFIAKRYLFAKSSQNVINIINKITGLVVVIGGASLFIVLAGFAGLKNFALSFSSSFDPDLRVLPEQGKFLYLTENEIVKLSKIAQIQAFSKIVQEQVFLNFKEKNHIAQIKGVDENYPLVNQTDSIIVLGSWETEPPKIVVGVTIFNQLGLSFADASSPLQIIVPKQGKGSILNEQKPYREIFGVISGVYQLTEDLDKKFVFSSLSEAQYVLGLSPNQISAIDIKLKPQVVDNQVITKIQSVFNQKVIVKNRRQLNDALYRMLNTENAAVYLIFMLVLIVALFNLAGAIIMMILDKNENLKTLYALGMPHKQLRQIFFLQGFFISVIGAILGIGLGSVIVLLQQHFNFVKITQHLSYPVEIQAVNVLLVFATIVILGSVVSFIASSKIKNEPF